MKILRNAIRWFREGELALEFERAMARKEYCSDCHRETCQQCANCDCDGYPCEHQIEEVKREMKMKRVQQILTPTVDTILDTMINVLDRGGRIVSVCPHYERVGDFGPTKGYILVVDMPKP